jgi:hypothetical protein
VYSILLSDAGVSVVFFGLAASAAKHAAVNDAITKISLNVLRISFKLASPE